MTFFHLVRNLVCYISRIWRVCNLLPASTVEKDAAKIHYFDPSTLRYSSRTFRSQVLAYLGSGGLRLNIPFMNLDIKHKLVTHIWCSWNIYDSLKYMYGFLYCYILKPFSESLKKGLQTNKKHRWMSNLLTLSIDENHVDCHCSCSLHNPNITGVSLTATTPTGGNIQ